VRSRCSRRPGDDPAALFLHRVVDLAQRHAARGAHREAVAVDDEADAAAADTDEAKRDAATVEHGLARRFAVAPRRIDDRRVARGLDRRRRRRWRRRGRRNGLGRIEEPELQRIDDSPQATAQAAAHHASAGAPRSPT
jgi:hypothetical protein